MKKRIFGYLLLLLILIFLLGCSKKEENITGNSVSGKSVISGFSKDNFFTGSLLQKVKNLFKKEQLPLTKDQKIDSLLDPVLEKKFLPPQSLKDNKDFKNGFVPKIKLKDYMIAFTNDENHDDSIKKIMEFQRGLNGLTLNDALVVDEAMANSLKKVIDEVKTSGESDQESCGNFNALLNPSILTMDLTLWKGKSKVYDILKQNRDIGIQCEFYYPQLKHGMFAYDLVTGKLVQRTAFCDNSEKKSKCFGVWNYFWKFAMDQKDGAANYGSGCSLVDWMNQGFVCTNGVDLKNDKNGKLIKNEISLGVEGQLFAEEKDVKSEFVNPLGASGNAVVGNVKGKCSQISQKTSLYGDALGGGGGSSLTGLTIKVPTKKTSATNKDKDIGQTIEKQYESSMLFASQFAEACLINIEQFKKDNFGGGGGGGGLGGIRLNRPSNCLLSQAMSIASSSKGARFKQCVSSFSQQVKGAHMQELTTLDKAPTDLGCGKPSASSDGCNIGVRCLTEGGNKDCSGGCGRKANKDEAAEWGFKDKDNDGVYESPDGNKVRMIDSKEDLHDICGARAASCAGKDGTNYHSTDGKNDRGQTPTHPDGTPYTKKEQAKHEDGHQKHDDPKKSFDENEEAQRKRDEEAKKKKKSGTPSPDDTGDGCSSQAEKWAEQLASCTEDKGAIFDSGGKPVNKPRPDPAPDSSGGNPSTCETPSSINNFNTAEGAKDDCMFGDSTCDFVGAQYGGSVQGALNKKCQYAGSGSSANVAGDEGEGTGGGGCTGAGCAGGGGSGGLNKGLQCPSSIGS